ncbi:MAG: transcriptional regulator BetI [Rhodobacteraceae bacterium]|nr:transcriptional regulator BetI [Paracoccaceae bacterium]
MPKTGMEPVRRAGLVDAAIMEIGRIGSLEVTVGQIAKRAGVSSALAHHYFGTKDQIFLSAMRHILSLYGEEVRKRLANADTHRARLEGIIEASFDESNFRPEVISAWLNFYVRAQNSDETARILGVYKSRLRSNLLCDLRPLLGPGANAAAEGIAALIDGLYVRQSLGHSGPSPSDATRIALDYLDLLLARTD